MNKDRKSRNYKERNKKPHISTLASHHSGITLVALVVTIIVLLILAGITITILMGDNGIIRKAQDAADSTNIAVKEELQGMNDLGDKMNSIIGGTGEDNPSAGDLPKVADNLGKVISETENTELQDSLGNKITVPAGFYIVMPSQDSTVTYDYTGDGVPTVQDGIVIQNATDGNQFVWIPVGDYNVSTMINSTGKLTNDLTRRTFTSTDSTPVSGDSEISSYYYGEGDSRSVAYNQINAFKASVEENKGIYIGRYEAGTEIERTTTTDLLTTPLVQANKYPYVYVTRDEAKQQAEAMYADNKYVTSELISSYAWDTVLNFICQINEEGYLLATIADDTYGNINTGSRMQTGKYEADNYLNIHDFLGNCREWTTEYSNETAEGANGPCVVRGEHYYTSNGYSAGRGNDIISASYYGSSFRIQLYINPNK